MNKRWLMPFLVISFSCLTAQNGISLKGTVIDFSNKEFLVGAVIYLPETGNATATDPEGKFELKSVQGVTQLKVSFIGYNDTVIKLSGVNTNQLRIALVRNDLSLNEVEVVADANDATEKVNNVEMGVDRISMIEAKLLPAILGEVDIIKILQLKPGVKSGGEGTAGFFVRGGSSDQNLILVERAPVYNPNHLFGFFSVFNSDAVKNVTLYKSGFPSQFGGRLSSVLDVEMKKSQADSLEVMGGIGLLASRLTINVPIVKKKLSLLVAGRRTYLDLFTNGLNKLNKNNEDYETIPAYFFYDFNTSLTYNINQKNKIALTGYFGNDVFKYNQGNFSANLLWGNRSATLDWKHIYNDKLTSSTAYVAAGYLYRINLNSGFAQISASLGSRIWDQAFLSDWNYYINKKHILKFGLSGIYHRFTVGEFGLTSDFTDIKDGKLIEAGEMGAYLSHDWHVTNKFEIQSGLRNSTFTTKSKTFNGLEPRLALKYSIFKNTTIKASYAKMYQYLHLVSSSGASLPIDVWYPSEEGVNPQSSDQVSLGLHQSLANNKLFVSVEGYYKWIKNAIDFKDGAQLFANTNLSKEFVFGKGWAYGIEAYIEKKKGKTTGWIGYTLAWTWRQFDNINYGIAFHPRYDRRHDVSIVVIHQLNARLSISATWVYGTGNYATIAGGRFAYQSELGSQISVVPDYLRRNEFQMPATHRLDLGLVWKLKSKKWNSDITFSLYNAYSRRNPFFIYYAEELDANKNVVGYKPTLVSLFPILPAITYNFKF
jgi:hypothetical protein